MFRSQEKRLYLLRLVQVGLRCPGAICGCASKCAPRHERKLLLLLLLHLQLWLGVLLRKRLHLLLMLLVLVLLLCRRQELRQLLLLRGERTLLRDGCPDLLLLLLQLLAAT